VQANFNAKKARLLGICKLFFVFLKRSSLVEQFKNVVGETEAGLKIPVGFLCAVG